MRIACCLSLTNATEHAGFESLLKFLASEFTPEPLLFCRAVMEIKEAGRIKTKQDATSQRRASVVFELNRLVMDVFERFVRPGAPSQVRLPNAVIEDLRSLVSVIQATRYTLALSLRVCSTRCVFSPVMAATSGEHSSGSRMCAVSLPFHR